MTNHLREIRISRPSQGSDHFPLNLPILKGLDHISLPGPVSIFVGENGSGKSTLLEAIARKAEMITVGTEEIHRDPTLNPVQPLVEQLTLVWNKRTHRGFFLRAEDFFGYTKRLRALQQDFLADLKQVDEEYRDRSDYARALAAGPAASSVNALNARYGGDLDANSHGESFLTLFKSRFVPDGLYILDEPEAALSPLSQLGLISMIKEMVAQGGQFIIATHSPILMAIPGCFLFDLDTKPPGFVQYNDLEHVRLYRSFMENPESYINRL